MEAISKQILKSYQVRKTRKQKDAFITFLREELKKSGDELFIEESGWLKSRNLVVGDIESAAIIFGAHYDTCAILPFPNFLTPKNIPIYVLFNLVIVVLIFLIEFVLSFVIVVLTDSSFLASLASMVMCIGLIVMLVAGKANPHTVNDNTSGVITLLEIMSHLDENSKKKVAFVFFDHEEVGLIGSSQFVKKHKKKLENKLLFNFDCVSDGDTIMLIHSKTMKKDVNVIEEAFKVSKKEILVTPSSKTLYPSDQMNFKHYIAVAAFRKKKWLGYYLSRIHTKKDVIMDEMNIEVITQGSVNFVHQFSEKTMHVLQ